MKQILRQFKSSGKYTLFNILGLTLGLSMTILMVLLLVYEFSFDRFHSNSNKILCIGTHDLKDGSYRASTACPLAQTLKNDFPEVKYVAGFYQILHKEAEVAYNGLTYKGFTGASVDNDAFSVFDFKILLGNPAQALRDPNRIMVSKGLSEKIFGNENSAGKILDLNGQKFSIEGIFDDMPENSAFNFDILFSEKINQLLWDRFPIAWWASQLNTFVILNDGVSTEYFNEHLKQIPEKYYPDFLKGRSNFVIRPFKGMHFDSSLSGGLVEPVSVYYLFILGIIAFLTLLISTFNFISLSTAQLTKQNISAGIRKISGAKSFQIIARYISFSSSVVFVALLLATFICWVSLPIFELFVKRPLASQFSSPVVWIGMLAICAFLALISGAVPGVIFAKVKPVHIFKKRGLGLNNGLAMRRSSTVFQFGLTIALLISQLFIFKQIYEMMNADLGFNNNNLIAIGVGNIDAAYQEKYMKAKRYKVELEKAGTQFGISSGTISENVPGFYYPNSFSVNPIDAVIDECLVKSTSIDDNYLDVYQIQMAGGRFFSADYNTDKESFIINETAMKKFGWKSIEGKYIKLSHEGKQRPVVGVMKDIVISSLKNQVPAMIFRYKQHNNFPGYLTFRIDPEKRAAAISFAQETWVKMFPNDPFDYLEVKETYFKNYESEKVLAQIISVFSVFALVLCLLGMLGMISFIAEVRTKEIGIRKVNGAKISEILSMLNKDFIKWVAIAFVIATPIAWYAMHQWLENFAYKTSLSWWVFALAGVLALGIALLTVSFQSYKAAVKNPVESLRYE